MACRLFSSTTLSPAPSAAGPQRHKSLAARGFGRRAWENEIKALVVDDKWFGALDATILDEMDRVIQQLTRRVKDLAERYETPLRRMSVPDRRLDSSGVGGARPPPGPGRIVGDCRPRAKMRLGRPARFREAMSQHFELTFRNVLGTNNALWDLGGKIAMNPSYGDHDNWLLTYRDGLRGMYARILAVDRHFLMLHQYQSRIEWISCNPNEWLAECEYHAGVIFFGMDSSLECFVFAVNARGFAKDPNVFCSITDARALRQISPKNISGAHATDRANPRSGYNLYFPRTAKHWKSSESLLCRIFEYHDVTKHRSAVAQGGSLGELRVREEPKQPGSLLSSMDHTLESITLEYQVFIDELLLIALEEGAKAFGYEAVKHDLRS